MTSPSSSRRTIAVLVLAAVLLVPWAAVAAPGALPANRAVTGALGDLLARFWGSFVALWSDGGCSVDPSGHCGTLGVIQQPVTPDSGCSVDPNGGCVGDPHRAVQPPVTPDGGCSLDPSGGCAGGS